MTYYPYKFDYMPIGCSGFAQFGTPEYEPKQIVEGRFLMEYIEKTKPIPDKFKGICYYKWMSNPYEGGRYHDLVLMYNRDLVDDWEVDETLFTNYDEFYTWFNEVECLDLESEEILDQIKALYEDSEVAEVPKEVIQELIFHAG